MTTEKTFIDAKHHFRPDRPSLRLGCVIHSLNGGGAERVMAGLASRLALRGHDVTLLTLDDGSVSRHPLAPSVKWRPLDVMTTPSRRVSTWQRLRTLRRELVSGRFDRVLSFCDSTNLTTLLAMTGTSIPIIVSERSDPAHQSLGPSKEFLRRRVYRRAAAVVCQTEEVAVWLKKHANVDAVVIASAVDPLPTDWCRNHDGSQAVRLLAVGRLEHEKGFDRLLRVLERLPRTTFDWHLTICGEGSQRASLERQARELDLENQVSMPGWVSPITDAMADADVFVLPSRYEGFPSALLEAMSCGLAVVAVDAGGGVRQIVRHGINGVLAKNEEASLMNELKNVLADAELRRTISKEAGEVQQRFGWAAMVDAYETVLVSPAARFGDLER